MLGDSLSLTKVKPQLLQREVCPDTQLSGWFLPAERALRALLLKTVLISLTMGKSPKKKKSYLRVIGLERALGNDLIHPWGF